MQAAASLCLIWSHREIDFPQKLINFSYSPELEFKKRVHTCWFPISPLFKELLPNHINTFAPRKKR